MKPLFIKDGRIIDPSRNVDKTGSLLIADGQIKWFGQENEIPYQTDYDVLSAKGMIICPGFIDLHCHLRDPGFEDKETVTTGSRAAARGGFTTICCMPNTNPPLDNPAIIEQLQARAAKEAVVRVLPIGCITKGRKGKELAQLAELAASGVVGFSDDGDPLMDSALMRQALEASRALKVPVIDHCGDAALDAGGVINEGLVSSKLKVRGMPAAAEEIMVARDIALAELTGGWIHICHVSTKGSVELIRRAKNNGIRMTAEVTPHHLTLTEAKVIECGSYAKMNPPLRTSVDMRAMIQGLKDGVIDIIATDHAPHTEADKKRDLSQAAFGIVGLETALGSLMGLVHSGQLSLTVLIAKMTYEPARILGGRYGELGSLAVGSVADITVFDPEGEWVVDQGTFASKGKNTPLAGATLKGKVVATISQGKVVYKDESLEMNKISLRGTK